MGNKVSIPLSAFAPCWKTWQNVRSLPPSPCEVSSEVDETIWHLGQISKSNALTIICFLLC
jgi:hypothetical protein